MYTRDQLRSATIAAIILQQQLPRLLVECGFRIWVDQQALYGYQDVLDPVRRFPVLFERVDADFAGGGHVWVEYFRGKPTCGTTVNQQSGTNYRRSYT